MARFRSISLEGWRQFLSVSIDLHERLTIITGSNGAGKSTILNICSQHFGYSRPFISTPKRKKGGGFAYDLGLYESYLYSHYGIIEDEAETADSEEEEFEFDFIRGGQNAEYRRTITPGQFIEIGKVVYDNDVHSSIGFHENQSQTYGLQINNQQPVAGVPISSHRMIPAYQPVQGITLQLLNLVQAYNMFSSEYVTRLNGGHTQFSPLYRMKEALIGMAAFGPGNSNLEANSELSAAFDGFTGILRKILPREIGFRRLVVRVPDIVLKTRTGEWVLDASSGGITAVIEIAWQLYLFSMTNNEFVVTLDEPENHLHPSMQRTILSNLVDAFPQAQFIVATHSPFIVSAVENSNVYALKYVGQVSQSGFPAQRTRSVRSIRLDQTKKAGNASEILKEVLGVSVSMPEWAARRLDVIIAEFEGLPVTKETLKRLRTTLAEQGFSEFYPEALAKIVGSE